MRPKVLILAFACEPDFGSEPEVGWRWATEMSKFADITVITDEGHREAVEAKLQHLGTATPLPTFHFFGPGPKKSRLFRWFGYRGYYRAWMRKVRPFISALHARESFDLMHHVTYAGCRFPTAVWGHGAPVIWGPVGGVEPMPLNAMPWSQPKTAIFEMVRNVGNWMIGGHLKRGGSQSALVLASTEESRSAFRRAGIDAEVESAIGIEPDCLAEARHRSNSTHIRLVFAGRLLALKGIALAIRAVAQVPKAILTIIGEGPFGAPARALVKALKVESQIEFRPPLKRPDLLKEYQAHDVLIYPSFHDSGGFVVLEAMASGLPVICLESGGPAIAVQGGCGIKVPVGNQNEMVQEIAGAIRRYEADRALIEEEGANARRRVEEQYLWSHKAERMAARYRSVNSRS